MNIRVPLGRSFLMLHLFVESNVGTGRNYIGARLFRWTREGSYHVSELALWRKKA